MAGCGGSMELFVSTGSGWTATWHCVVISLAILELYA